MIRRAASLLIPALLLASTGAGADVLYMQDQNRTVVVEKPIELIQTPSRGMSMERVRSVFGNPTLTSPAVGDPPITRWDFDKFHVFFEHNLVLHAVIPGNPLRIDHQDELAPANAIVRP